MVRLVRWSETLLSGGLRASLIAAVMLAGLTGACARFERTPETSASEACDSAEAVLADLEAVPLLRSEAIQGISISPGRGTIEPTDSYEVVGPCAQRIARFVMELVYVPPSTVGRIEAEGRIVPVDLPYRAHTLTFTEPHPELAGGRFLMADRVDSRRVGGQFTDTFVGLWSTSDGAFLGSFTRSPGGMFSPVVEEIRTSFSVQGISYFPSLHGGVGRLGLISHTKGNVQLVALQWYHPEL